MTLKDISQLQTKFYLLPYICESQLCPALCDPCTIACQTPLSIRFSRPEYWNAGVGSLSLLQGNLPNPGIEPRSPVLQADSLPSEPPGKPKNTGVGNLSLLQWIFLTQELNWGLLHCRWILYQLNYQGSHIYIYKLIHLNPNSNKISGT